MASTSTRNQDTSVVVVDKSLKLMDRWAQRWPEHKGCLVGDPAVLTGKSQEYAYLDIAQREAKGYEVVPLTKEERLLFCQLPTQLLMLCPKDRWEKEEARRRKQHPATPDVTEQILE